ncbi:Zn-dependent hydrolase [Pseudonocardia acaciae]|uniref:Zn-dependent hydrolase n=1 Tax=Pseudonocardia acaciae TaxID=551276 RepID=UPI000491D0DA|nr:Zn-dependent hydrolase [Pseudonocardia acaciae]
MEYPVDAARLEGDLRTLAGFSAPSTLGGVTRRAWSEEFFAAQAWLIERFEEAGLAVHVDAVNNIWGRWEEGSLPAVVAGSHIDSVPSGGAYDGCLGVLGALEAIRALRAAGHRPSRQLWVVAWMEEEGSNFGTALLGSRAFVGDLDLDDAAARRDLTGRTLAEAVAARGHDWSELADLPSGVDDIGSYLELHIEQGPILEAAGLPVGVVTDIVCFRAGTVTFTGVSNHAGTTPMEGRRDAAVGAARAIVAARDLAVRHGIRATTGRLSATPGGSNVIPGAAAFSLDTRHRDKPPLDAYLAELKDQFRIIADDEGLTWDYSESYDIDPVPLDPDLQKLFGSFCEASSIPYQPMVSGAGHDAMALAPRVPAGMLFVPSRAGVSHAPSEYTSPEHCALGADLLARAMARLSE